MQYGDKVMTPVGLATVMAFEEQWCRVRTERGTVLDFDPRVLEALNQGETTMTKLPPITEETVRKLHAEVERLKEERRVHLIGPRLNLMETIRHCYPNDDGGFDDDTTDVYVEQEGPGKDSVNVEFVHSLASFTMTFLDAKALDDLSTFFARAAQQLRYCNKENPK